MMKGSQEMRIIPDMALTAITGLMSRVWVALQATAHRSAFAIIVPTKGITMAIPMWINRATTTKYGAWSEMST